LKQSALHQGLALGRCGGSFVAGNGEVIFFEGLEEFRPGTPSQVGVGDVPRYGRDECRQFPGFTEFALPQGFQDANEGIMQEIARSFPVLCAGAQDRENAGPEERDQFGFGLPVSGVDPLRQFRRVFSVAVLHEENHRVTHGPQRPAFSR
jgi:hypothetical protein